LEVTGANYASCNGQYELDHNPSTVPWAPEKPVYISKTANRFMYWLSDIDSWSIASEKSAAGAFYFSEYVHVCIIGKWNWKK
jgi:hypothetical protein